MSETPPSPVDRPSELLAQGDVHRRKGGLDDAIESYLDAAASVEVPESATCIRLARALARRGDEAEAARWALAVVDAGDDFSAWQSAASLLPGTPRETGVTVRRSASVAVLGSYTTSYFTPLLRLAALRLGIDLRAYEGTYGQYRQEILDPSSGTYAFGPDLVLLAVHEGELGLPPYSADPEQDIDAEFRRWSSLWDIVAERSSARVVQHNFVVPPEPPLGHLAAGLPGSRYRMTQSLNARLGYEAPGGVAMVDCDRLAAGFGKERWFDPRYWHLAKLAVSMDALPLLARHTAAVIAAQLGLTRKCLAVDLDNTLWGGIIGEDGLGGIVLGDGPAGEGYAALQEYLVELKNRGVILAVCSKNDAATAKEPFEKHPGMRLRLDDIAVFAANWDSKVDSLRSVADTLGIGLDAIAFLDDNPVERQEVRRFLPEVDVIALPPDQPSYYACTLARYLGFESASLTSEDAARTTQYQARAQAAAAQRSASSIEDFYRDLDMRAAIGPFAEDDLPRIAQLIGKTNQFNLTTRRHGLPELAALMADEGCVHRSLRLRDRFTDHGLVSLVIAFKRGDVLDIDTWLMSCRVIGRTVERTLLAELAGAAEDVGCTAIVGTHIPTEKNRLVQDLFGDLGFAKVADEDGVTTWRLDLTGQEPTANEFIEVIDRGDYRDA